jgi:hypothetical protein
MEPTQKNKTENEIQAESNTQTVETKPSNTNVAPAPKKTGFWDKMKTAVTKAVDCCLE